MSNAKAIIAAITKVVAIPGADKIQVAYVLGEQVIVSKDAKEGDIGVFFPVDVQLSKEYVYENNLSRHKENNKDVNKVGFFDENRRVRAQPFMKVKSQGYFAGVESLHYINPHTVLIVGGTFDEYEGRPICNKYVSPATQKAIDNAKKNGNKQAKKDFAPLFKKHVDSKQFKHEAHMIPAGALLSFHSKKHGTSGRSGITKVAVELPKWKSWINKKLGREVFPAEDWAHVVGSRNVTFKPQDAVREHVHGSDSFRHDVADLIKPFLENGITAYYEIVGFVNGKSIMPSHDMKALKDKAYDKKYGKSVTYSYGCKEHEYKWHIYRLTYMTATGESVDFTQKQLEGWCDARNLPRTLDVAPQEIYDGDFEKLSAKVEQLTERPELLTEDYSDPTHISEGIIVRVDYDGMTPKFYKAKSYAFRVLEGHCDALDTEDAA